MNKEQEQVFLNQIEEVLHAHEDTYEPGAWEEFDANRNKKRRKLPIYWWAAAVVLLFFSFGLLELTRKDEILNHSKVVKNKVDQSTNNHQSRDRVEQSETEATIVVKATIQSKNLLPLNVPVSVIPSVILENPIPVIEKSNFQLENPVAAIIYSGIEKPIASTKTTISKPTLVTAGAYDSLMNRNRVSPHVEKNMGKLTYSLVVSPSLSNQKMNFGAGMGLSFSLNNSLSINSGLMYTAINAKSDGKSLAEKPQGASLALSGIELPLGIQYQTQRGFYAAAGVSAVGLINDRLEYSYLQEKIVTLTEFNAGITTEVFKVVSEKKTENSIEPLNNYMGFFNFSAGKKQAFGKVNLNIGPFVKVPFSSVSTEKIKLLQGGIRISVDF